MRIRVDEIPESGRFLHFHWDEERLNGFLPPEDPFEMKLIRPVNVDLEIQKGADHIKIQGKIEGTLQVGCHRCLDPFPFAFDEKVDLLLMEGEEPSEDEEIEFEEDESAVEFFDGETIDVDQLVAEQIFLTLPFKLICSENCRGLCPNCGSNLNHETCQCGQGGKKSSFSDLLAIRDKLNPSPDATE
jgi:uncharacterized protein